MAPKRQKPQKHNLFDFGFAQADKKEASAGQEILFKQLNETHLDDIDKQVS